jgi:hypothetical protein
MKTVIEMAREAGGGLESDYINISALERLVELARADEREKYKWDVHSCGPTCTKVACVAMREAVKAEREACAKVCEENATDLSEGDWDSACINCADHIRARGQA